MEDNLKEVLEEIIKYCDDIISYKKEHKISAYSIEELRWHKYLITMPLMQIGEEVKNLPEDFKKENTLIPWGFIVGNRNAIAHDYKKLSSSVLEKTIEEGVPELMSYCRLVLINIEEEVGGNKKDFSHNGLTWQ